jgi:cytochrome c biogenesis protein CcmG/thiol:disulfide interchange protein DsbE
MDHDSHRTDGSRRALLLGAPALALAGCFGGDMIVPDIARSALPGLVSHTGWPVPGLVAGHFRNKVTLLNVWASWCGYCRGEHALLMALEQKLGQAVTGLVHLDEPEPAAQYLRKAGNPFRAVGHDTGNVMGRAIRQRGVPSTLVIGHDGLVVARWPGGLSDEGIDRVLRPGVAKARERHLASLRA